MKANGHNPTDPNGVHTAGWARRSLNLLKSFHHPMTLPHIDDDGDEEMEIDEDAVEKLCNHVDKQLSGIEDHHEIKEGRVKTVKSESQFAVSGETQLNTLAGSIKEQCAEDTDVNMEEVTSEQVEDLESEIITVEPVTKSSDYSDDIVLNHNIKDQNGEENTNQLIVSTVKRDSSRQLLEEKETFGSSVSELLDEESQRKAVGHESSGPVSDPLFGVLTDVEYTPNLSANSSVNCASPSSVSIIQSNVSPVLKSPTPSVSPRISNSRKSLRTSSMLTASQKDLKVGSKLDPEAIHLSLAKSTKRSLADAPSIQMGKNVMTTTEHLAASLHRGLEIIDSHRQSSAFRRSAFRLSFRPADLKQVLLVEKVNVGVQTSLDDGILEEDPVSFLCNKCKNRAQLDIKEANENSHLQLVPVDGSESADKSKLVPKVSIMASSGF